MKYLIPFILSVLFIACGGSDQKAASTNPNKDSAKNAAMSDTANFTTIQWLDSVEQNLGTVNEGQVVEITWRFKNTGNKPLIIARVQPGCGCTVAEQPQEPIAPGQEGKIKAKFDSNGHPHTQNKDVFVYANNSNKNNPNMSTNLLKFHIEVTPKK
jgi:Protein of unknown function (DUF1573).